MPIRPENARRYPPDWKAISLRLRSERAGWRCECRGECLIHRDPDKRHPADTHLERDGRCGARQGDPTASGRWTVVLTVAHLDHTPENCDPLNLLAMCQSCHLRYDGPHHAETRRAAAADPGAPLLF